MLGQAVNATFVNRRTAVKADPVALTTEFSESEVANIQWRAFVRKGRLANAPARLGEAVSGIVRFLLPVARENSAPPVREGWLGARGHGNMIGHLSP